jgi:hypothetical protein
MFPLQVAIEPIIDWGEAGAAAITSVGVLIAVQAIKYFLPMLRARYPWAIPIIAVVAGPALAQLGTVNYSAFRHSRSSGGFESDCCGAYWCGCSDN